MILRDADACTGAFGVDWELCLKQVSQSCVSALNGRQFGCQKTGLAAQEKTDLTVRGREVCHSLLTTTLPESLPVTLMSSDSEESAVTPVNSPPAENQNVRIKMRNCRGMKWAAPAKQAELGFSCALSLFFSGMCPTLHSSLALNSPQESITSPVLCKELWLSSSHSSAG